LTVFMTALLALLLMAAGGTRADADAALQAGRYQEAGEIYLALLRQTPRDTGLLDAMGQTLRRAGQFRQAAAFFQQEMKLDPANRAAARALAATFQEGGALDPARDLLTQLTTADPKDGESWYLLGLVSYRSGYYPAAIEQLDRALRLTIDPTARVSAENARAISLVETGRTKEAADALPRLLSQPANGSNIDLLLAYARLLYEDGLYEDALKQADRAAGANPSNASAHFWRARILQREDKALEALSAAERARDLSPESPAPRNLLVRLYRAEGREADAEREAEWLRVHEAQAVQR
jgi:tetratricopeptide (TPR) repeat protein